MPFLRTLPPAPLFDHAQRRASFPASYQCLATRSCSQGHCLGLRSEDRREAPGAVARLAVGHRLDLGIPTGRMAFNCHRSKRPWTS